VGAGNDAFETGVIFLFKSHGLNTDFDGIPPQGTQHDGFAVIPRQVGHTEVDLLFIDQQLNTTVLRQAFFGNVHAGHDLEAGRYRRLHAFGDVVAFHAHAVDAVA